MAKISQSVRRNSMSVFPFLSNFFKFAFKISVFWKKTKSQKKQKNKQTNQNSFKKTIYALLFFTYDEYRSRSISRTRKAQKLRFINNIHANFCLNLCRCNPLSIRTLLELNESCLRLHGFNDPWYEDKKLENIASISRFNSRLEELDKYTNPDDKWLELFRGLLAGKTFCVICFCLENIFN